MEKIGRYVSKSEQRKARDGDGQSAAGPWVSTMGRRGLHLGACADVTVGVKADISREMELDELKKLQQEVQGAAREIETSMTSAVRDFETGARDVEKELAGVGAAAAEAATLPPLAEPPAATPPVAASPPAETEAPARQASLPGFDRI